MIIKIRNYLFLFIRISLLFSILTNAFIIFSGILSRENGNKPNIVLQYPDNIELIFFALITFFLSFGSSIIEKQQKINIPDIIQIFVIIFIYAGIFLSVRFRLYYTYWWWDDLLHGLSGIIIGFIGFIVVYKINNNYSMNISPLLVAIFSFTFAVTIGVIWEIFEFTVDTIFQTAMQKWDLPETEVMMGKPYQGSGLRDTMSDLILNSIGALFTSFITYFMYKFRKEKTLNEMKKIVLNEDSDNKK